ncbi:hypothetical protein CC86DRAFT_370005 [Ophiobolus disseminans]|uniref:Lytic polysaccharide monooxygenase n=1 Tax=Ophiobolus disseminans TaxID=1469910 RepID=A0A6A7A0T8_9PLEO|nr:hypothetical protein CC86DRAFT_370005 [Ophiobolus disseminans]
MFSQTTLLLAFAAGACAHMRMASPKPYGFATLSSAPLTMAEFPCKQRPGVYTVDLAMNQWNPGETKPIIIMGTAVHGGGSCQYSITTDPEPTKDSQWKVIHSVVGNCMASIMANYDEEAGDPLLVQKAFNHTVTMPSNIPEGRYTFAWSWMNKLGNREFYMNCAPIQVGSGTGTASTESAAKALGALPDMFVANLDETCQTIHGIDFVYPDPGQSVERGSSANLKFSADFDETKKSGCAKVTKMGAGAGKIGSPSPGTPSTPSQGSPSTPSQSTPPSVPSQGTTPTKPSGAPASPQVSQQPAASPSSGYGAPQQSKIPTNPNGGGFAPGASSAPASGSTPQASAPAAAKPTPPAAQPVQSTTPQTPGDNNTTPANGECTPCTNDGAVVCIGSKQFGLCNRGCAVAQDLAAGMACSGGVVVAATKRHVHFPRAHLHRRFSASRFL